MKIDFIGLVLLIGILVCNIVTAYASGAMQYELTHEKIERAWVTEIREGLYQVRIKLSDPHKETFSQLTENNIGKKLAITFSGDVLISPIIRGKIDSGIIVLGKWNLEADARKFVKTLKLELEKK